MAYSYVARLLTRGRIGMGIAMHCCSAEREVVGVLNVLRRGENVCVAFILQLRHISKHRSLYLGLVFSSQPSLLCTTLYLGVVFLYFFGKVPKTLALRF